MSAREVVSFRTALGVWTRVALQSFGGPAGQIAVMHRIVVDERRWLSEERFLHALNFCMLLPGPEAQQLATYIGWLMHGVRGGLLAGVLFILPGFLSILALSLLYVYAGDVGLVAGLFAGLKPAVFAVVVQAVLRVGGRVLRRRVLWFFAAGAFLALFALDVPFPWVIAGAAAAGTLLGHRVLGAVPAAHGAHGARPDAPADADPHAHAARDVHGAGDEVPEHARPSVARAVRTLVVCATLWAAPLVVIAWRLGADSTLGTLGAFFSRAAVVTFGGAYAVLSYVAQQAVDVHGWLRPGEMLDGLGMAETTPGPLIQVVQFVGFLGAHRSPDGMDPLLAGVLGALLTTWVTFVPCFLWIFLGAPFVERLRGVRALDAALTGITAAVVGVILNLAVWFGLHVLFADVRTERVGVLRLVLPDPTSVRWLPALLAAGGLVAVLRYRVGVFPLLGTCALIGVLAGWIA